jgi:structure-specific endonuclease subunit SLX1
MPQSHDQSTFFYFKNKEVLPVDGTCPKCKGAVLWGDLVRLKNGCYQNLEEVN